MTESEPRAASSDDSPVRSEHSGDYLRLARLWQRRTHFSLIFAAVDNIAYRDALIHKLDTISPAQHIELTTDDTPLSWLERLRDAHHASATRVHIYIHPDASLPPAWWQQANLLRERLAETFPNLMLVWLSDTGIDTAAHAAPDLWNWREAVFSFTAQADRLASPVPGNTFNHLSAADSAEVQQRLQDITLYIKEHGDEDAIAYLRLEAADAYRRLGRPEESEASAREAVRLFLAQNNALHAAQAQGKIADILQARGQLDEALALHAQRLPVAEALGDIDSICHIKFCTAQIRLARGDHQHGHLPAIHADLAQAYAGALQLGRPVAIGAIGGLLAKVLVMRNLKAEASTVLDRAEAALTTLGNDDGVEHIRKLRKDIVRDK